MTGSQQVGPGVAAPDDVELRAALVASGIGTWHWDVSSGVVRWDTALEELAGMAPGTFGSTYEAWLDTLHPDEVAGILTAVQDAIASRGAYHFEHRVTWPDGSVRWLECRGQVTVDDAGEFSGTVGCAIDVTARRRSEDERSVALERERRLRSRLEFLVGLTDIATTATDHLVFLRAAAQAAVPKLGDWCSIHFVPEPGADIEVVVAHTDPSKIVWAEELAERFPYEPGGAYGVAAVMKSGTTEFIETLTDELVGRVLADTPDAADELSEVLDQLGITSVITTPLTASRGVLGAMQFVNAESGNRYDHEDVALAELVASRVADAVDNLWLTDQQRHIASILQRALLPPQLPTVPGVDVAVRYWPAGVAVDAGGDFYDLFQTSGTSWSALIGDVCGSGPNAAAVTSIARHTVRAAARHGFGHREVLDWLNQAVRLSNRDLFCTAIYSTLEHRDGAWWLALAAGGHPLPVLVPREGAPGLLGVHGTLLGVFETANVTVVDQRLEAGDVVVMYTDGITDLPPPHGLSESDAVELVAGLADSGSAEAIADAIHRSVTSRLPVEERVDDIALVVLRITASPLA